MLFGLCLVPISVQLFQRGPIFLVDEVGIHDQLGFGVIPWEDILVLWIGSMRSERFLCVEVREPKQYVSRLPFLKRWFARANTATGFPPMTIGFSGISPGLDKVWRYLRIAYPDKTCV